MDVDPSSSKFRHPTSNRQFQRQEFYKRQAGSDRQTGLKTQQINHVTSERQDTETYVDLSEAAILAIECGEDNINFLGVTPSNHSSKEF